MAFRSAHCEGVIRKFFASVVASQQIDLKSVFDSIGEDLIFLGFVR